jgi:hypothetical protein
LPLDLTVDVGVVMAGSSLGDPAHFQSSLDLLKAIESREGWSLALDSKGRIRYQYEEKVKQGFGQAWLRRLASTGRISMIKWQKLNKGIVTGLKEEHFDTEDFKYVETAAATSCRKLVSHDPDYSTAIRAILRRINLSIIAAADACALE